MQTLFIYLVLLLVAGCAKNPVSGDKNFVLQTEAQEISIGQRADLDIRKQYRVYTSKTHDSAKLQEYVNRIGQKIARASHRPHLQFHFAVLDSPEINAFALPGGYVYVTRGILAYLNSEAELAAVLGHEIGHVTARHGVRQSSAAQAGNIGLTIASIFVPQMTSGAGQGLSNALSNALLSGYGREHELEADRLGAEYLARTEYDPQAMIKLIGVLKNQELFDAQRAKSEGREARRYHGVFSSHPNNDRRLHEVVEESRHLTVANPKEGREEYMQHIDGMVFNESGEQGVLRNNQFLHSELGIAVQFPAGWRIENSPDKLIAVNPNTEAMLQLVVDTQQKGQPADIARQITRFDARNSQIETHPINQLPAAMVSQPISVTAVIQLDKNNYVIAGQTKTPQMFAVHQAEMIKTIKSFHVITAQERALAKPVTLKIITTKAGDNYSKIAQNSPLGNQAEAYLRLINAHFPQGEPAPGQQIKVVR